jgi:uncharacterized protein (DUF427 family)
MTSKPVLRPSALHPISVEPNSSRVTVTVAGRVVADTHHALTLREASCPAVHYIPRDDVDAQALRHSDHTSYCPFKGDASHYDLQVGDIRVPAAAWTYDAPHEAVSAIKGHVAFYPDKVDAVVVQDLT